MRTPSLNKMTEENQRPFTYLFNFTIHVRGFDVPLLV